MTALAWDQPGERRYETGVDRGVLYFPLFNLAIPWNGLVSVTEGNQRDVKSYFMDGIKYLDHMVPGAYSAKVQAYTYPDLLDALLGNTEIAPGVVAHDQRHSLLFNMSYRTLVANDTMGEDYAYKIHLVWNVTAVESDAVYNSLGGSFSGVTFEWNLTGTPDPVSGMRPTCHVAVDTRRVHSAVLQALETRLYGSSSSAPSMPSLVDLVAMVS